MTSNITLIGTVLIISTFFAKPNAALAQDGSLDLTFDADGIVTTPVGTFHDYGRSVAIQSDGKIVVAGFSLNGASYDFALVRYNTNGSLDSTFDTDGKVTTPVGSSDDFGYAVALQSDGKIVVAGQSDNGANVDFALVRYNTNGSLDSTFDADGKVTTPVGTYNDYGHAVALQSDGKIVMAGYSINGANSEFALVRYNTNGSLDSTFDTDGIVTTPFGAFGDEGYAVAIQSDGKIVAAGAIDNGSFPDFALIRYNTNGSLDNTFDADGIVITPIGFSADVGYAIALQSDGKIVAAGFSDNGPNYDFALVRYNTNGSLDNTFDADGKVTVSLGASWDDGRSVAIQSDGKIVVAGYSDNGFNLDFALVRYNTNGSLDSTFDADGIVTTPIGISHGMGYAVALQSDGKIVVAGSSSNGSNYDFALARYNATPVGINTIDNQPSVISVYPNPFSTLTTFQSNNLFKNATLTVYNLYGQQVKQINNLSGQTITLHRDNLPSGLYFIYLTEDNTIIASNKIIITD